jgi:predicted transcriptional regulator
MEIALAQTHKSKLEEEIMKLIIEFEKKTMCNIKTFEIQKLPGVANTTIKTIKAIVEI